MKIHGDNLTTDIIENAAARAGVRVIKMDHRGSKTRQHAYEIALSGRGVHGGMYGNLDYPTALWDEWGIALAAIFEADPTAHAGKVYESADHFHWVTGDRFRTLTPSDVHLRHNWLSGDAAGRSATGSYYVRSCKCGAVHRFMARGRSWAQEIAHEFAGVV